MKSLIVLDLDYLSSFSFHLKMTDMAGIICIAQSVISYVISYTFLFQVWHRDLHKLRWENALGQFHGKVELLLNNYLGHWDILSSRKLLSFFSKKVQ